MNAFDIYNWSLTALPERWYNFRFVMRNYADHGFHDVDYEQADREYAAEMGAFVHQIVKE